MSEATKAKRALVMVSLAAVALMAATAQGDILGFIPQPESDTMPEFIWDGVSLSEGPGSHGTGYMTAGPGDGEPSEWPMAEPGLTMIVPFEILGIPGGIAGSGSTSFYDTTLDITTSLPATGPAVVVPPPAMGGTTVFQPLGAGAFELWSTDPVGGGEDNYTLLLAGTVHSAHITGTLGATTGAVLNADVTYTDGVIAKEISDDDFDGSFVWTLLDMSAPLAISATTGWLEYFEANGTGHFTPEPGTIALLSVGGLLIALRRRRRRVV